MNWFYNDSITLIKEPSGEMYHGTFVESEPPQKVIACDVQPMSREQIYTDHGYFYDAEYIVYCDVDTDIKDGSNIVYKKTSYKIVKMIDWDDYYILYLKAVGL